MSFRSKILAFEARANALDIPLSTILKQAELSRASWWRWKKDDKLTWEEKVDRILSEHERNAG
jgi:hypothetical protein